MFIIWLAYTCTYMYVHSFAPDVEALCHEVMVLLLENVRLRTVLMEHQQKEKSSSPSVCEASEPRGPDGEDRATGIEAATISVCAETSTCVSSGEGHIDDRGGELGPEVEPVGEMSCSASNEVGSGGGSGGEESGCVGGGGGEEGGGKGDAGGGKGGRGGRGRGGGGDEEEEEGRGEGSRGGLGEGNEEGGQNASVA